MSRRLLPALAVLWAASATGQAVPEAALWVEAEGAEGVFVNGVPHGAPGAWLAVVPGALTVRAVDDLDAWDPRLAERDLVVSSGDSVRIRLDLPRRLRIETLPIRAEVSRVDADGTEAVLGTAPLTVDVGPDEDLTLVARLGGYDPARATVEAVGEDAVVLMLRPHPETDTEVALLPTERSTAGRTLVDLGIGAAALAAGAAAIHLKFRADGVDDRYRSEGSPEFGDEALRQEAIRLDRLSAVALGAMQVGVGVLAVRFVLR